MNALIWQQFSLLLWAMAVVPVPSSATVPPAEIPRYFLSHSFSRQYVCTEEERECFKKDLLLHEADGKCYAVGEQGPCAEGQLFHADKQEADRKGGHLRGTCARRCEDPAKSPLALTGECLTKREVEDKVCRKDRYLRPVMDVFAEWVCDWTTLLCKPPEGNSVFGGYYGDKYNGICSAPAVFTTYKRDGKNATVPAEKPLDHPWLQYFTNKTHLEGEFLCTEDEEACLKYGRLLHSDGNCYSPGQWNGKCEPGQVYHLDFNEAVYRGRLQGTCRSPCKNFKQPQTGTGSCEDYSTMSNICKWEWGLQIEQNVFGEMACTCGWSSSAPPTPPPSLPPPASSPGYCRAPDFSNPVHTPSYDLTLTLGFNVPCSEEEFACLRGGRVLAGGACHALRTRGPCAEGEELVLDKEALRRARLQTLCKARPCPEGSVRLPIDGQCLTHKQVISLLCVQQKVALDEFGGWQCDYGGEWPGNLTRVVRDAKSGHCELPEKYGYFGVAPFSPAAGGFGGASGAAASGGSPGAAFAAGPAPGAGFAAGPAPGGGFAGRPAAGGFGGGHRPHPQG